MKLKAIITGSKVHGVGYRVMLVNKALSLGVSNFNVFNTFLHQTQAVIAVIEGDEEVLEEFKTFSSDVKPDEAEVSSISFEEYRNTVPPIERCMQAFQMEQWGKGIPILSKMLEKQDITIDVLKSVKEDTAQIRQDTSQIPRIAENTSIIPEIKEDTSEIKSNTKEIVDKLWDKYEEMSREIAQIKITLSRIEARVFAD
ncbi:MAG: acylphosphatase [Candidatus Methanoperedens sp.]